MDSLSCCKMCWICVASTTISSLEISKVQTTVKTSPCHLSGRLHTNLSHDLSIRSVELRKLPLAGDENRHRIFKVLAHHVR
jgi:hypothetical protein